MKSLYQAPFERIALDNGALRTRGVLPAYLSYCRHNGVSPYLKPSKMSFSGIENGSVPSLRIARLRMPLGKHGFIEFETDIINKEVPLLFGLDHHLLHLCSLHEVFRTFTHYDMGVSVPVVYKKGHLYFEWPSSTVRSTKSELKKHHTRFAHPSVSAMMNLFKRSKMHELSGETRAHLDTIAKNCKECHKLALKPSVFRV